MIILSSVLLFYITIIHLLFRMTDRMGQSAMAVDVALLPDSPTPEPGLLSCAGKIYVFVFWNGEVWERGYSGSDVALYNFHSTITLQVSMTT